MTGKETLGHVNDIRHVSTNQTHVDSDKPKGLVQKDIPNSRTTTPKSTSRFLVLQNLRDEFADVVDEI